MEKNEPVIPKTTIQITTLVRNELKEMKTGQMTYSVAIKKLMDFFKSRVTGKHLE